MVGLYLGFPGYTVSRKTGKFSKVNFRGTGLSKCGDSSKSKENRIQRPNLTQLHVNFPQGLTAKQRVGYIIFIGVFTDFNFLTCSDQASSSSLSVRGEALESDYDLDIVYSL